MMEKLYSYTTRNEKKKQEESDFRRVQEINEMRDNLSFQKAVKGFHGYNNTYFLWAECRIESIDLTAIGRERED